jgi:hypothetical protein
MAAGASVTPSEGTVLKDRKMYTISQLPAPLSILNVAIKSPSFM